MKAYGFFRRLPLISLISIILLSSLFFSVTVVNVMAEDVQKEPRVVDSSGKTTFHGVFVGMTEAGEKGATKTKEALEETPGWAGNTKLLSGSGEGDNKATRANIKNAIDTAKTASKAGDEFIFYFAGHAGGTEDTDDPDTEKNEKDEPEKKKGEGAKHNGYDEHIEVADDPNTEEKDDTITDDELTEWLSGFPECVSIVVILDCCWAGHFVGGSEDLQGIKDAKENPVCKLGILMAAKDMAALEWDWYQTPWGRRDIDYGIYTHRLLKGLEKVGGKYRADSNGDGNITAEEWSDYAAPRAAFDDDIDCQFDEDPPGDANRDGNPDDDGDNVIDEDGVNKLGNDDDNDGNVDEDPAGDKNRDGFPGVKGVDDDGDDLIDEDSKGHQPGDPGYTNDLKGDDDEDGRIDEDPENKPPKQDPTKHVRPQDQPPHEKKYVSVIPPCCPQRFVGYTTGNEVQVGQTFNVMLSIDIINDTSPAIPPTNVIVYEILPEGFSWVTWNPLPESHNETTAIWAFSGEDVQDTNITCSVKATNTPGTYHFTGFVHVDGLNIAYFGDDEIFATAAVGGVVEVPGMGEPGAATPDLWEHDYGASAGIVAGAIAGVIALTGAVWYIRRRRTKAT